MNKTYNTKIEEIKKDKLEILDKYLHTMTGMSSDALHSLPFYKEYMKESAKYYEVSIILLEKLYKEAKRRKSQKK